MNGTYLKIKKALLKNGTVKEIEFVDGTIIGSRQYDLLPSSVHPTHEVIKNAERSLDGTMSVDIINVKTVLSITYDVLNNSEFHLLNEVFDAQNQHSIYPDGIEADYFDLKNSDKTDSGTKKTIKCFIDSITYLPYFTDNGIKWRDFTITLVEI